MSGMNKVILVGNLGSDPEITQHGETNTRAVLNVATNESYLDKEGKRIETTEWHRVVVWGSQAEVAGKFLHKGSKVCVEGQLQTRKWIDKENRERTTTEIRARRVVFLDRRAEAGTLPMAA